MKPEAARFLEATLARQLTADLARILSASAIDIAPLKGALLLQTVYAGAFDREISDVDVLVPAARFDEAVSALRGAGFEVYVEPNASAVTLHRSGDRFLVDLHRTLFRAGLFALDAGDVIARATPDEALFGARVLRLDPLDLYAHLVGHFAKGRHDAADRRHVADFAAVARHFALDVSVTAAHLEAHGLARAARYALGIAARSGDGFAREVLGALRPDPIGELLAHAVAPIITRYGKRGVTSAIAVHLLSPTLPRAVRTIVQRAAERLSPRR